MNPTQMQDETWTTEHKNAKMPMRFRDFFDLTTFWKYSSITSPLSLLLAEEKHILSRHKKNINSRKPVLASDSKRSKGTAETRSRIKKPLR